MSGFLEHISDVEDVKSSINDICLKMYNYGRADAIPEGMMLVAKDDFTEDLLNRGYTKGRRDAIDECLSVVEWDGYTLDIKRRIEALKEQMKGEQNDYQI